MEPSDFLPLLDTSTRKRVSERACDKGEQLFRRGDTPSFMFYVLDGEARLLRNSPTGVEVVFQRARHGFLAEASLDHPAYHCDGVSAKRSRILVIPIAGFRAALSHEKLRGLWLRHLSNELRRVRAHSERLALRSASERIIHFVETEGAGGELTLSHDKKTWSAKLGLTHEALYRAIKSMSNAGILEVSQSRIRLKKPSSVAD